MYEFLPTGVFKWIDPKEFELCKCSRNSSKVCALEVGLEYPKELCELHKSNISNGNVIKFVPDAFDKERYVLH